MIKTIKEFIQIIRYKFFNKPKYTVTFETGISSNAEDFSDRFHVQSFNVREGDTILMSSMLEENKHYLIKVMVIDYEK